MPERIGVFGAGGFARQIIDFLPRDAVFFTDEGGGELHGFPVLPFDEAPDCELLIAVSDPALKRRVALGWRNGFGKLVAPTALASEFAALGEGAIVCHTAVIEAGATIGRHFHANVGAMIAHECNVGDFVTVGPSATICGRCTIGKGATIGARAVVRQGTVIGEGAFVGMGAVVVKDVPAHTTVIGNPAREMFDRRRVA